MLLNSTSKLNRATGCGRDAGTNKATGSAKESGAEEKSATGCRSGVREKCVSLRTKMGNMPIVRRWKIRIGYY